MVIDNDIYENFNRYFRNLLSDKGKILKRNTYQSHRDDAFVQWANDSISPARFRSFLNE